MKEMLNLKNPKIYAEMFLSRMPKNAKRILMYGISDKRTIEIILDSFPEAEFVIADCEANLRLLRHFYEGKKYIFINTTDDKKDLTLFNEEGEIGKMPRFDVAIMNPPYGGTLHLDILEKIIPLSSKLISISPDTWCAKHNRWKNIFQNYKNSAVAEPVEYEHIEHREANDLFGLGNQIESLGIMVYDEANDNKIDLTKFGFSNKEFNLYNKIMSDKEGKLIWRNRINIVEPSNSTKKFIQPVNIWHGGDTCYEATIGESRNHKKGKIQWQAEFDTKNELQNFQNSFKTKFMEWYYKFIVIPSDCKLHMSMFVMDDYTKPWTDKRFCNFFGISEEEWNYMLKDL